MRLNFSKGLILGLAIIAIVACKKDGDQVIKGSDQLTGYWINQSGHDSIWTYERAARLKDNAYGFSFKDGQVFIERKNAGWCGTPPITYADFEGSWARNDSAITITVDYWGGEAEYLWEIISLNEEKLVVLKKGAIYQYEE